MTGLPKKNAAVRRLLAAAISGLLLWLAVRRADAAAMKASLDRLDYGWLFTGIIVFGLACFFGAIRWHCMLLVNRCNAQTWHTCKIALVGHWFNTLLFGPAGGDIVKAAVYSRWRRCPLPQALAACWMDRLLAGLGSLLFAFILIVLAHEKAFAALSKNLELSFSKWLSGVCLLIPAIAAIVIWKRKRPASILSRALDSLKTGFAALKKAPASGLAGILLGTLVQLCLSSVLAFNLRACTPSPIPWNDLFWIFPIVSLLTALPVTVAGIGVREGASILLLGLFGVPSSAALTASFLTLAVNLFWAILGGIVWWVGERRFNKSLID